MRAGIVRSKDQDKVAHLNPCKTKKWECKGQLEVSFNKDRL